MKLKFPDWELEISDTFLIIFVVALFLMITILGAYQETSKWQATRVVPTPVATCDRMGFPGLNLWENCQLGDK